METEYRAQPDLPTVLGIVAIVLAALLLWAFLAPPAAPGFGAAPVPTLQPTPQITIPAGAEVRAAAPQISGDGNTVTITNNYTIVDTDVCVALVCPPRGQP
jgi:hypothetical protein